jgi:hypothetical protein
LADKAFEWMTNGTEASTNVIPVPSHRTAHHISKQTLAMATKAIVVLQTLASKNSQDEPVSAAAVAEVKKQDGFVRAFVGQKLEDPDTSVFCTRELPLCWLLFPPFSSCYSLAPFALSFSS